MKYTHQLTSENQDFLNQDRTDPITGEKIEEGHSVVICAACKSAFFIESWEYLGDSHCDQTGTLEILPKSQNLYLQVNPKYTRELLTFGFSNKPMFTKNEFGCFLFTFFGFFSVILGIIVGTSINTGLGFLSFIISIIIVSVFAIKISEPQNTKTKFSIYIDYKKRGLVINNHKRKNRQIFIPFEEIRQFKYHIIYHPSRDISALFCQLQIRITTKTTTKDYFATIHRDTIPEWSDFISKLPTDLRIINTAFINEHNY